MNPPPLSLSHSPVAIPRPLRPRPGPFSRLSTARPPARPTTSGQPAQRHRPPFHPRPFPPARPYPLPATLPPPSPLLHTHTHTHTVTRHSRRPRAISYTRLRAARRAMAGLARTRSLAESGRRRRNPPVTSQCSMSQERMQGEPCQPGPACGDHHNLV